MREAPLKNTIFQNYRVANMQLCIDREHIFQKDGGIGIGIDETETHLVHCWEGSESGEGWRVLSQSWCR